MYISNMQKFHIICEKAKKGVLKALSSKKHMTLVNVNLLKNTKGFFIGKTKTSIDTCRILTKSIVIYGA